jgi:hypothetical protein
VIPLFSRVFGRFFYIISLFKLFIETVSLEDTQINWNELAKSLIIKKRCNANSIKNAFKLFYKGKTK